LVQGFAQASSAAVPSRAVIRMRMLAATVAALAVAGAGAKELTKETWDEAVAGKTAFVKFQAPW